MHEGEQEVSLCHCNTFHFLTKTKINKQTEIFTHKQKYLLIIKFVENFVCHENQFILKELSNYISLPYVKI